MRTLGQGQRVAQVLAEARARPPHVHAGAAAVLGAGEQVRPHVVRQLDGPARGVGDHEGRPRLPELRLAVAVDDLRAGAGGRAPLLQPVGPAADGVGQGDVGERELVAGIDVVLVLLLPAPRLTELVVGEGLPRAGDVGMDAVEDDAARDVLVEALVQEVAQHAPALGDADRDRGAGQPGLRQRVRIAAGVGRLVAQERDGVAHRREPEAQHDGVLRLVDELVDGAAVEPGGPLDLDLGVARPRSTRGPGAPAAGRSGWPGPRASRPTARARRSDRSGGSGTATRRRRRSSPRGPRRRWASRRPAWRRAARPRCSCPSARCRPASPRGRARTRARGGRARPRRPRPGSGRCGRWPGSTGSCRRAGRSRRWRGTRPGPGRCGGRGRD